MLSVSLTQKASLFQTDIVLNFRTAFVNEQDVRETSPKAIAKYYMSGWFPIDFISECNGRLELVTVAATLTVRPLL